MHGEFRKSKGRLQQIRGQLRKNLEETCNINNDDECTIPTSVSMGKLSFRDAAQLEKLKKKKRKETPHERKLDATLNQNAITTQGDKIIDKSDSSFTVKIQPLSPPIDIKSPENFEFESDDNWNELEAAYNTTESLPSKVPDAATIYAAKKKRKSMRHQQEIIDISVVQYEGRSSNSARLVREGEGYSTSDEEFADSTRDKIPLAEPFVASCEPSEGRISLSDQEEASAWEALQMAKGAKSLSAASASTYGPTLPSFLDNEQGHSDTRINYRCSVPRASFSDIINHITPTNAELETVFISQKNSLNELDEQIEATQNDVVACDSLVAPLRDSYEFYQFILGYIKDFSSCHDEKILSLERLECDVLSVYGQCFNEHVKSFSHQISVFDNLINSFIEGDSKNALNSNSSLIETFYTQFLSNSSLVTHFSGASEQTDAIKAQALSLFSDTFSEFYDLDEILKVFYKWKRNFPNSYIDTFTYAYLYKVLAPCLRLKLIDWCPLVDEVGIESHSWFTSLVIFSSEECDSSCSLPDLLLLPDIFDYIICPKVTSFVEVLDCLSRTQNINLTKLVRLLFLNNPKVNNKSSSFITLFKSVFEKLVVFYEQIYMPLYPSRLLEDTSSGAVTFLFAQLSLCLTFIKNCLLWTNLLNTVKLKELVVERVVNQCVIPGLTQIPNMFTSLEYCSQIVDIIPNDWLRDGSSSSDRSLISFVQLVQKMLRDIVALSLIHI